jgi:Domain of unknown function DUF83
MNKDFLVKALIAADDKRSRSQQTAIGVSQLGACRRQVWFQLNNQPKTNQGLRLASIMGTAIHTAIESALTESGMRIETSSHGAVKISLTGEGYLLEHRVEIDGYPPATIDCFDPATGMVVDFKTTTKKNLRYFPSQQQRWQVQVYGFLMAKSGYEVNTVKLIAISRDGTEQDIREHVEPYNETVALEALAWLKDVESMPFEPAPEKSGKFCSDYCAYYGEACRGK